MSVKRRPMVVVFCLLLAVVVGRPAQRQRGLLRNTRPCNRPTQS